MRPCSVCLPEIYERYLFFYKGKSIQWLCGKMQSFYKERRIKDRQKELFQRRHFRLMRCLRMKHILPWCVIRANWCLWEKLNAVPLWRELSRILRVILAVIPGERWTSSAQQYFSALVDSINEFPGFAPELQGVYIEENPWEKGSFRICAEAVNMTFPWQETLMYNKRKKERGIL